MLNKPTIVWKRCFLMFHKGNKSHVNCPSIIAILWAQVECYYFTSWSSSRLWCWLLVVQTGRSAVSWQGSRGMGRPHHPTDNLTYPLTHGSGPYTTPSHHPHSLFVSSMTSLNPICYSGHKRFPSDNFRK